MLFRSKRDVEGKVGGLPGVTGVKVEYGEMNQEQRSAAMARARFNAREHAAPTEVPLEVITVTSTGPAWAPLGTTTSAVCKP